MDRTLKTKKLSLDESQVVKYSEYRSNDKTTLLLNTNSIEDNIKIAKDIFKKHGIKGTIIDPDGVPIMEVGETIDVWVY